MAGFGALVPSEEAQFTSSPKQSVLRDELVKHVSAEAPVFVCLRYAWRPLKGILISSV